MLWRGQQSVGFISWSPAFRWDPSCLRHLNSNPKRLRARTTQLSRSWTPIPQKLCEIISVCCFKLVNYRLICCTAIINNNVLRKIKVIVSNNSNIQLMCPRSPRAASTTCPLDDGAVEELGGARPRNSPCSGGDEQSRLDSCPLRSSSPVSASPLSPSTPILG